MLIYWLYNIKRIIFINIIIKFKREIFMDREVIIIIVFLYVIEVFYVDFLFYW